MAKSLAVPAAPTIRTVAQQAGVAVSTVSRVINGGSASDATRRRVNEAIAQLGFTPTLAAQGLVNRRASAVGLVVDSTRGSWFSELIAGVEEALGGSRESVLIASLRLTGQYSQSVVADWIRERRVDGLLFARCSGRELSLVRSAIKSNIPVALIAADVSTRVNVTVSARNVEAGLLLGKHLLALGHQRFAFVGGPEGSRDTADRLQGVREALSAAGRPAPSVSFGESYYPESGAAYAETFCALPEASRPTAVLAASDALALGFCKAILQRGYVIPRDVSVAGFDNSAEAELFWPGLTSVAQPSRQMAAGACRALLGHIDGGPMQRTESFVYDVELVVRESCSPPPR